MARKKKEVKEEIVKVAEVKVTRKYFDIRFNRTLEPDEEFECSVKRYEELKDAKVADLICLKNSL